MTRHRRLTALTLALALVCALALPAGAAAAPKLTYTQSGSSLRLKLQDLGQDSIYGVQLELTLAGECTSASFTPASATAYAPPCTRSVTDGSTLVTVYLTGQSPLNKSGTLELGTLTLSPSPSLSLPDTASVTLLNRDLKPLTDGPQTIAVSRQTSGGSGSTGGSGGGSRPTPTPAPTPEPTPEPTPAPELPFADVAEQDWFYREVKYIYGKGMMNGTSATTFAPNDPTSRAMIVTILYRLAGSPPAQTPTFSDVPAGQYYTYPVGWAAGQSIVNGYETGQFQPSGLLTREQLAAILYRYSRSMGYNTAQRGDLTGFADCSAISPYAVEPLSWAVGAGLLSGMGDGTISPGGQATRAQVAAILARFCKTFVDAPQGI